MTTITLSPASITPRRERWLLLALLLLAGFLRLSWPGLTEFKADEAHLLELSLEMADFEQFPLRGISSSVGFPNFPMSVWLYGLPTLLWAHPIAATLFTGLLNALAVLGCYWLVRRYWGVEAALAATLMFAVSPWALHHSRKIWAQNLLPFFVTGWGISALLAFVEKRPKWILVHLLCLAVAVQVHLAGITLVPATAVYLFLFRRRVNWRLVGAGSMLALLTAVPFIIYLLTQGQRYLRFETLAGSGSSRTWSLAAVRHAWRLTAGVDIHALAGAAFADFLAQAPPVTAVHWLWALLVLVGLLLMAAAAWRQRQAPAAEAALICLIWLAAPIVLFSWPRLPAELHYLLPVYPVPFVAGGIGAAALARRIRWLVWPLLLGTAVLQVWLWFNLLTFVSTTAAPGGFGVPLRNQLAAATAAREQLKAHSAAEVLIVGPGVNPASDEFAAVYGVHLRDVPHRFVDGQTTAVFPNPNAVILALNDDSFGPSLYRQQGKAAATIPQRLGEPDLLVLTDTAVPAPDIMLDSPPILTNWVSFAGIDPPQVQANGTAIWRVYWNAGESSNQDFHLFNHLLNESGDRLAQQDTAVFPAAQWRAGDVVVTQVMLPWDETATAVRMGMYAYPSLEPVLVFDVAGNPAADSVTVEIEVEE